MTLDYYPKPIPPNQTSRVLPVRTDAMVSGSVRFFLRVKKRPYSIPLSMQHLCELVAWSILG